MWLARSDMAGPRRCGWLGLAWQVPRSPGRPCKTSSKRFSEQNGSEFSVPDKTFFLVIPSEAEGSHPSNLAQTARFLYSLRSVGMTILCFVRYIALSLKIMHTLNKTKHLGAVRILDGKASTVGLGSNDIRLLRVVRKVQTETRGRSPTDAGKAGVDGPKSHLRSPQIKSEQPLRWSSPLPARCGSTRPATTIRGCTRKSNRC